MKISNKINLTNCVEGALPFILSEALPKDKRQIILCPDNAFSLAFYQHISTLNPNSYIVSDFENDTEIYSALNSYLTENKSIILTKGAKDYKYPSPGRILDSSVLIKKGERIDPQNLVEILRENGFERTDNVFDRGEFAYRGFIIDIYDTVNPPTRIEFENETIESLRKFRIDTQLSGEELSSFRIVNSSAFERTLPFELFFEKESVYDLEDIIFKSTIDSLQNEEISVGSFNIRQFEEWITSNYNDYKIFIFCSNEYEKDKIKRMLRREAEYQDGAVLKGFADHADKMLFINDFEIFGRQRSYIPDEMSVSAISIEDIDRLEIGDNVVHQIYGIGRYAGIERIQVGNRYTDCLKIYYKNDDKLYVPIDQIYMVDKYISSDKKQTEISSLDKQKFERQKNKVKEQIKKILGELLRLYAEREMVKGFSFLKDDDIQMDMEEHFEYDETPDQITAIEVFKKDMISKKPMDRLICGEVGFGKTEVAARAALKCVLSGKQAVFLGPTTILAEQHFRTIGGRLKPYGVRVEMLSRFVSSSNKRRVIAQIAKGDVDIVIATHSILSDKILFKDLGLLIIDEEHKFGVKQKEKLKDMKSTVDVLSMSATPIPRTMEMALSGIRDISNILTPPAGRQSIETHLVKWDENLIKNAAMKEIARKGQIYFIHNRIESLKSVEDRLKMILPDARIVSAHAQMHSNELEEIMAAYWAGEYDILLSTTIIESGIDNPNANTMFINRADTFGLAQLHQLRGRIGRSSQESFCYLIIPEKSMITDNAKRRLYAFKSHSSIGAGLSLALKDLEIRGAGNLLGTKQHGSIGIVGFSLYFKLLKQAIDEIKGIRTVEMIEPTINIPLKTYIPDGFEITRSGKTQLYREISGIERLEDIEKGRKNFIDKYGVPPDEIDNIFILHEIKMLCKKCRVSKILFLENSVFFEFFLTYVPSKENITRFLSKISADFEVFYDDPFRVKIKERESIDKYMILKRLKSLL